MLFNIEVDILVVMIEHAKADGHIEGVIPHLVDGGLSILQYTNYIIIFMKNDFEKAQNLKLILAAFEQLLVLNINFHKSELFCFVRLKMRLVNTLTCSAVDRTSF
jgi:hypothetical protein